MDRLNPAASRLRCATIGVLALIAICSPAGADDLPPAGYLPAIRQELARLSIETSCDEATRTCSFAFERAGDAPPFAVTLRYSDVTDTIYISIDRFVTLADPAGPSLPLARRLLELNRQMVTAKLEWDPNTGLIRLSVVLNTDSNFDRRAFRSQVRGLKANAERLHPELSRLAAGAPAPAPIDDAEAD